MSWQLSTKNSLEQIPGETVSELRALATRTLNDPSGATRRQWDVSLLAAINNAGTPDALRQLHELVEQVRAFVSPSNKAAKLLAQKMRLARGGRLALNKLLPETQQPQAAQA